MDVRVVGTLVIIPDDLRAASSSTPVAPAKTCISGVPRLKEPTPTPSETPLPNSLDVEKANVQEEMQKKIEVQKSATESIQRE
jgi:hypothetical protein